MAQIFPKWTNATPPLIAAMMGLGALLVVGFFWYYGSPKYTDVGYQPKQPVPYSHKLHAGDLGIDCRYCHSNIERGPVANLPSTQVCMNCHTTVRTDSPKLALVRQSWQTGEPIKWVRIHKLPDYAYFDHSVHLRAGVGCVNCHGRIDQMEEVAQAKPLSMGWCLDCHRNPEPFLMDTTKTKITDMTWKPAPDQLKLGARLRKEKNLNPPEDCSACHR